MRSMSRDVRALRLYDTMLYETYFICKAYVIYIDRRKGMVVVMFT